MSFASDDCLDYKLTPNINIKTPIWEKSVVQPLKPINDLHGNVIATFTDNFEITTDLTSIEDGFCVSLKDIDVLIGYSDFLVQIDLSYKQDTCSYNAVLQHEDEHIRAYLSVIEDNKDLIKKSIQSAADSIMPVFIKNESDIESAIDELNEKLQNHPDIVLLKQHIKADEEIRNKHVDLNDTGETLKKCLK
jgi:hypothetical protein